MDRESERVEWGKLVWYIGEIRQIKIKCNVERQCERCMWKRRGETGEEEGGRKRERERERERERARERERERERESERERERARAYTQMRARSSSYTTSSTLFCP